MREGVSGSQTGLRDSEIITVSTDSPLTSQRKRERERRENGRKGKPAGGMLHYILLKEQHIVQVGLVESTAVH